jgi:hypothetical protein
MRAVPRVPVADAGAVQRLPAAPEPHTGRVRRRVEVRGDDDVQVAPGNQLLDESGHRHGLQLPLPLIGKLPAGAGRDEQERPDGRWHVDVRGEHRTRDGRRARREAQLQLPQLTQRPAAGQRQT